MGPWTDSTKKKKLVAAGNMDKLGIKSKSVQDNDTNKSIEVTKEGKKEEEEKDEKRKKEETSRLINTKPKAETEALPLKTAQLCPTCL